MPYSTTDRPNRGTISESVGVLVRSPKRCLNNSIVHGRASGVDYAAEPKSLYPNSSWVSISNEVNSGVTQLQVLKKNTARGNYKCECDAFDIGAKTDKVFMQMDSIEVADSEQGKCYTLGLDAGGMSEKGLKSICAMLEDMGSKALVVVAKKDLSGILYVQQIEVQKVTTSDVGDVVFLGLLEKGTIEAAKDSAETYKNTKVFLVSLDLPVCLEGCVIMAKAIYDHTAQKCGEVLYGGSCTMSFIEECCTDDVFNALMALTPRGKKGVLVLRELYRVFVENSGTFSTRPSTECLSEYLEVMAKYLTTIGIGGLSEPDLAWYIRSEGFFEEQRDGSAAREMASINLSGHIEPCSEEMQEIKYPKRHIADVPEDPRTKKGRKSPASPKMPKRDVNKKVEAPGASEEALTKKAPKALAEEDPQVISERKSRALAEEKFKALTKEKPEALTEEKPEALTKEKPEALTKEKPEALTKEKPKDLTEKEPETMPNAQGPKADSSDPREPKVGR